MRNLKIIALAALGLTACTHTSTSDDGSRSIGNVGDYFVNKVVDDAPTQIYPDVNYSSETDDTVRIQAAVDAAAAEDANGGVVVLNAAPNGAVSKYKMSRIVLPSNIRVTVDPNVTLVMNGDRFLFIAGRTPAGRGKKLATIDRVKNVEVTSTDAGRRFKVDVKTHYPIEYRRNKKEIVHTRNEGQNEVYAAPFGFYFVENFAVSNVDVEDNYTVLPSVLLYADSDFEWGSIQKKVSGEAIYTDRAGNPLPMHSGEPFTDKNGHSVKDGDFIDSEKNYIPDHKAIVRNETWGRTPRNGVVQNIQVTGSHTGYGLVQLYGGDKVLLKDLHGKGGITVRLEPGAGKDKINSAGLHLSAIHDVEIDNISVTNGFTALWLKAHGKINTNVSASNIRAYDSGSAIILDKATFCRDCRDQTRGRFDNTKIFGAVELHKTTDELTAQVGYVLTLLYAPSVIAGIKDTDGNGRITSGDQMRDPSGNRWFMTEPIAPIIAISQLSATEIGDQSNEEGFFTVDMSEVKIFKTPNVARQEDILYRGDMINITTGKPETEFIYR